MLPTPRVIAIDDDVKHLEKLIQGLNQHGTACLPIHFTKEIEIEAIPPCPYVRVIFADLHLNDGSLSDHKQDFNTIATLLERGIKPTGPYMIVLWTKSPDQADALGASLADRLQNVSKPFSVQALDKKIYLKSYSAENLQALVDAIDRSTTEHPQFGALLNWEDRVLGAANDTVSSVMELVEASAGGNKPNQQVSRLLSNLASEAVGRKHVEEDRFRAVNEALLPILGDRIASMRAVEKDDEMWQAALGAFDTGDKLTRDEAAKLNRLIHIAPPPSDNQGTERGSVIALPRRLSGDLFVQAFDVTEKEAAEKQFGCKSLEGSSGLKWALVQTQAACDYAQIQPGPLPFYLGLCLPAPAVESEKRKPPPAALWKSPCFEYDDEPCFLHVNARFHVSLSSKELKQETCLFRLREQILNDLIYRIHSYGARPGFISFRIKK